MRVAGAAGHLGRLQNPIFATNIAWCRDGRELMRIFPSDGILALSRPASRQRIRPVRRLPPTQ